MLKSPTSDSFPEKWEHWKPVLEFSDIIFKTELQVYNLFTDVKLLAAHYWTSTIVSEKVLENIRRTVPICDCIATGGVRCDMQYKNLCRKNSGWSLFQEL